MDLLKVKIAQADTKGKTVFIKSKSENETSEQESEIITKLSTQSTVQTLGVGEVDKLKANNSEGTKKPRPIVCKVVVNGKLVIAKQMDLF
jgi:hypothetical protein